VRSLNFYASDHCNQPGAIKPDLLVIDFSPELVIRRCFRRAESLLDLGGGDPRDRSELRGSGFSVQARLRDIISVAHAVRGGMRCVYAMTGVVEQKVPLGGDRIFAWSRSYGTDGPIAFAEQPGALSRVPWHLG